MVSHGGIYINNNMWLVRAGERGYMFKEFIEKMLLQLDGLRLGTCHL